MAVIDTSVYIALINAREEKHASSWAWFEQATQGHEQVIAPVILLAEVAAALSRGVGDEKLARRVARQLERSETVELAPVSLALAGQAATIAAEHRFRGCDAIYLALAQQLDATLVTLDQQQLQRGANAVVVREP